VTDKTGSNRKKKSGVSNKLGDRLV
jgi:hypothetical protein